jgi:glycosyltransferase involved in cell wall biosynthesis
MAKVCILSSVHDALDNRVFYREARSLQRAGHNVTLIAIHERSEIKDGIRIIGLPEVPRWKRPALWWELVRRAVSIHADIYHFHDPELLIVAPLIRLVTGSPTIYDVHEVYADFIRVKDYLSPPIRNTVAEIFRVAEPLLARLQSALIFSDDNVAKSFDNVDRPKETLYNFPARFLIEEGQQVTDALDERSPAIIHLGFNERNRGTRLMVEAFRIVHAKVPEARLLIVGGYSPPSLEDEVRKHVHDVGLEDAVTITGKVPFEAIGKYLAKASVGWVPWQPFVKNDLNIPTKLFEYMAYQLPIVSSRLQSTIPFVHEGENGYLVTPEDPTSHARAHVHLLCHPEKAQAMGEFGQHLVDTKYNWDRMEQRMYSLYNNLLGAM